MRVTIAPSIFWNRNNVSSKVSIGYKCNLVLTTKPKIVILSERNLIVIVKISIEVCGDQICVRH